MKENKAAEPELVESVKRNVYSHLSLLRFKFPALKSSYELEHHTGSHLTNALLLQTGCILTSVTHGEPRPIRNTIIFSVENVEFVVYECNLERAYYIFCTVYHLFFGVLLANGQFKRSYKEENVMGYLINIEKVMQKIHSLSRCLDSSSLHSARRELIGQKKILLFGCGNIGHHIWNEQPGLDFLLHNDLLRYLDAVQIRGADYLGSEVFFKSLSIDSCKTDDRYQNEEGIVTSDILIRSTELVFLSETRKRLKSWVTSNKIENARFERKLQRTNALTVCIQIRQHERRWVSEVDGVIALIRAICEKHSNVAFMIDGFGKSVKSDRKEKQRIRKDLAAYKRIRREVSNSVNLTTSIGLRIRDKIRLLNNAALVVSPIGSGGVICLWLLQKDTIAYGPPSFYDWTQTDAKSLVEELNADLLMVPKECIKLCENSQDYDFDWHEIHTLTMKLLNAKQII
jgi:hypothetical protein